jgi:imidazolonepropionase-like amidohydrolase
VTDIAFTGATLLDGTGAAAVPDAAVVVADGRISWVGRAVDRPRDPGLRVVDAAGKYLLPGLLDANVHLVMHVDPDVLLRYEPGLYDALVLEAAQVALRSGVTTVFDTWGPLAALRRVRDAIDAGRATGSRIRFAGNIIGNGGPWSPDFFPALGEGLSSSVVSAVNREWEHGVGADLTWMSAADVRHVVRDYLATSGIDFVKYAASAHAHSRLIAFSPDAQRAIVEEAHAAGLTAQACAQAPEALRMAIDAGVDLLQHGDLTGPNPMPDETLDLIVERRLPCVAFLGTRRRTDALLERGLHWGRTAVGLEQVILAKLTNDRNLIKAGAVLLLGLDMGVYGPSADTSPVFGPIRADDPEPTQLGRSHLSWLRGAVEHGMDPADALLATTSNIARAYGVDDQLGTVEAGKRADLLVLDANPLDDPDNYARIAYVVKDGAIVDRDRLPERPVLTGDRDA